MICCRVAPSQKANIVSLIKEKAQEMTLAIGDGKIFIMSYVIALNK